MVSVKRNYKRRETETYEKTGQGFVMGYFYLAVFILYGILFFLSRKEKVSAYRNSGGKKSYPGETLFLKAAAWCIRRKGRKRRYAEQARQSRLGSSLKLLYPALPERQQVQAFYVRRCSLVLFVVLAGNVLALCLTASDKTAGILQEGSYIVRRGYGQGNQEVILAAQIGEEEPEEIVYTVEERKYTAEETARIFREAVAELDLAVLGDNESAEKVTKNLNLVTSLEGYPFQITWESDNYSLVQTDGSVRNEELEEAEIVMLTACFQYEEQKLEETFPVRICPAVLTAREQVVKEIQGALEEQNLLSRTDEALPLPVRIGSKNITWKEVVPDHRGILFLLICAAVFSVFYGGEREVEKKLAKRNRELLQDYPEIIHKLALYMGAGMTIRNAFGKMGDDYRKQKAPEGKRYVYEEILLLCHELQSGIPEPEAYAHLGRRCRLQPYMRLGTLLSQNIRKGSGDLLLKLRQEAASALEERKNRAKKAGEEAGTKLLLPMMMMLCIVMVLIMIPAYFTI